MDILVSSNLERQLFELTGRDAAAIAGWMADLRGQRRFRVDEETFARVRELFASDSIDNATCLDTIKRVFEQHGYLLDPHTAVAYQTARETFGARTPVLIASTAHWASSATTCTARCTASSLARRCPTTWPRCRAAS